ALSLRRVASVLLSAFEIAISLTKVQAMKKSLVKSSIGLMVTLQMTSSLVSADVSTNIAVVSNYLFRGVSQTDGSPAVQGGIDFEHASGFYAGTWASNVDFGDEISYELDLYAGFAGSMNDLGYDVGYV